MDEGESGYTLTRPNGKRVITVNSVETEERQRFTICHEIAHVILELPSKHDEVPSWSSAKRDVNEVMCEVFAAELLMLVVRWKAKVIRLESSVLYLQLVLSAVATGFAREREQELSSVGEIRHPFHERTAVRGASGDREDHWRSRSSRSCDRKIGRASGRERV